MRRVTVHMHHTLQYASPCCPCEHVRLVSLQALLVSLQALRLTCMHSGGYNKRNPRQGMGEVLVSRLIDRPLRPMFAKGWSNETQVLSDMHCHVAATNHIYQVLSWVLSYDGVHPTEPLAITAAGAALLLSDIPFTKAVAGVRIGLLPDANGAEAFVVNPTVDQMAASRLDLVLAGTADAVLMIEGFCDFLTEEQMLEVLVMHLCVLDGWSPLTSLAAITEAAVPHCLPVHGGAGAAPVVGT